MHDTDSLKPWNLCQLSAIPDSEESPEVSYMNKAPMSVPQKSPRKRLFQEDEYSKFLEADIIRSFADIDEKLTPAGFTKSQFN